MAANYCRVIKQQAEELKQVTVLITKLTFDQNAGNVRGTLHSDQRGVRSHCKVLICHTHVVGPQPCNEDIFCDFSGTSEKCSKSAYQQQCNANLF